MTNTDLQQQMLRDLMDALYQDNFPVIEELLEKGADINLPYNRNGWTPFMWMCKEYCNPQMIEKVLPKANVNQANNNGETPLHIMARHRGSFDCLELLIKHGANVNAQDKDGWTPLMDAVHHPQASMRWNMIEGLRSVSDTSIKNKAGKTAYNIACENQAIEDDERIFMLWSAEDLEAIVSELSRIIGDSNDL